MTQKKQNSDRPTPKNNQDGWDQYQKKPSQNLVPTFTSTPKRDYVQWNESDKADEHQKQEQQQSQQKNNESNNNPSSYQPRRVSRQVNDNDSKQDGEESDDQQEDDEDQLNKSMSIQAKDEQKDEQPNNQKDQEAVNKDKDQQQSDSKQKKQQKQQEKQENGKQQADKKQHSMWCDDPIEQVPVRKPRGRDNMNNKDTRSNKDQGKRDTAQNLQSYSLMVDKQIQMDDVKKQIDTSCWADQKPSEQQKYPKAGNTKTQQNEQKMTTRGNRRGNRDFGKKQEQQYPMNGGFGKKNGYHEGNNNNWNNRQDEQWNREGNRHYNQGGRGNRGRPQYERGGGRDYRGDNRNQRNDGYSGRNNYMERDEENYKTGGDMRGDNRNFRGNRNGRDGQYGRNQQNGRGGRRDYGDNYENRNGYQDNYRNQYGNNNYASNNRGDRGGNYEHVNRNYQQSRGNGNNNDQYRRDNKRQTTNFARQIVESEQKAKIAYQTTQSKEEPKPKAEETKNLESTKKMKISPRGQKCWPQMSIYIMETELTFSYRQITEHECDILIIPYRDLKFEIYPGNIINKCKADYRKKIFDKGAEISQIGYLYPQKCTGIQNFKALGFLKVEKGDKNIQKCLSGIFPTLKKLKMQISSVLIPYSKQMGPPKQFIKIITQNLSKFQGFTEVNISTNNAKDFRAGIAAFTDLIQEYMQENKICIDY